MSECTHEWETCPVHGTGDPDRLPSFRTVILCLYGDTETKDGRPVDETVAGEIVDAICDRAEGDFDVAGAFDQRLHEMAEQRRRVEAKSRNEPMR